MKVPRVNPPAGQQCHLPVGQSDTERHRRRTWRIVVFVVVLVYGEVLTGTGRDPQTMLATIAGVGLIGATVARWVADGAALPSPAALFTRVVGGVA